MMRAGERHAWHESSSSSPEESCLPGCVRAGAVPGCCAVGVWALCHCTRCGFEPLFHFCEIPHLLGEKSSPGGAQTEQRAGLPAPLHEGIPGTVPGCPQPCPRAFPAR